MAYKNETVLNSIPSQHPILAFPVRLETHFNDKNQLLVRIIPDEILIQNDIATLSRTELQNGKRFWIQWFIASGNKKREYAAWETLCSLYSLDDAVRISSICRPKDLNTYRMGGKKFSLRPYAFLDASGHLLDVMDLCTDIYVKLGSISNINPEAPEWNFDETVLTRILLQITYDLDSIAYVLEYSHDIVDYIFDTVAGCITYLSNRLDAIARFYERYPKFKENPTEFDFEDRDYVSLEKLKERVAGFLDDAKDRVLTLDEMTALYLDKFDKEFFGPITEHEGEQGLVSEAFLLPSRFMVVAQTYPDKSGAVQTFTAEGSPVQEHLPMGLNQSAGSSSYSVDAKGNLIISGGLDWLVDFEAAKKAGMGVVLNLPKGCDALQAVYAFGVRDVTGWDKGYLESLFTSHRYYDGGVTFLKTGTPTNVMEGCREEKVLDEKELMRIRYELEIEDAGDNSTQHSDGRLLAEVLGIDFKNGLNRSFNLENTEIYNGKRTEFLLYENLCNKVLENRLPKNESPFYAFGDVLSETTPRGIAPMFRIGNKPYGIVAASDLEKIRFPIQSRSTIWHRALLDSVIVAAKRWEQMLSKVPSPETMKGQDAERMFIDMVAQTPRSVSYKEQVFLDSPFTVAVPAPDDPLFKVLEDAGVFRGRPVAGDLQPVQNIPLNDWLNDLRTRFPDLEDWQRERLLSDFVDQFTFRIDTWYSAFVQYLRQYNRDFEAKRTPAIGCYGWVFDLKRNARPSQQKGEYIMAPSLQHALTAAVLRSAYLSSQSDASDSHLCINLSSMRVRQALRMLDGIKQGMSTGIILGADMERYLHEAHKKEQFGIEMDALIYPLRKLFPQSVNLEGEDNRAEDYQMSVINGEALLNCFVDKWQHQGTVSDWLSSNFRSVSQFDYLYTEAKMNQASVKALSKIIERVQDSYDALNDLLLAEGVHRLVAGDKASFAAISAFMGGGKGTPPSPAVLDSPSEYVVVSHKAALAVPLASPADNAGILTLADPCVAKWIGNNLGNPKNYVFALVHEATDGQRTQRTLSLSDVGVEIEEYFYLSTNLNVLKNVIAFRWRKAAGNLSGTVRILTGDPAELEKGDTLPTSHSLAMTLYEASLLVDDIRDLLSTARALRPGDLVRNIDGDEKEARAIDVGEIRKRYVTILERVGDLVGEMESLIGRAREAGRMEDDVVLGLYDLLDSLSAAGMLNLTHSFDSSLVLSNYHPIADYQAYAKAIDKQGKFLVDVIGCIEAVKEKMAVARGVVGDDPDHAPVAKFVEAIQALTMKGVKVFPKFRIDGLAEEPWEAGMIRAQLGGYEYFENLRNGFDLDAWLSEIAEVRPGMNRLHNYRQLLYFRYGNSGGKLAILQPQTDQSKVLSEAGSPHYIGEEWLGAPVSSEYALDDADSLMLFEAEHAGKEGWFCGFVFDSWLEYIPYRKKTAGLVFRCDQPDAEAPQALLLAIHPECNTPKAKDPWAVEGFLGVLQSAARMARLRTVSPDVVQEHEASGPLSSFITTRRIDENEISICGPDVAVDYKALNQLRDKAKQGYLDFQDGKIPLNVFKALINE